MEETERPVISTYDPGPDEDTEDIPRVRMDGWIRVQRYPGAPKDVYKVRTVYILNKLKHEILFPHQDEPCFVDGFGESRSWKITEATARAWFAKRGITIPSANGETPARQGDVPDLRALEGEP
jgi:hypothetical protein